MWPISKDLRGELRVADQERQQCSKSGLPDLEGPGQAESAGASPRTRRFDHVTAARGRARGRDRVRLYRGWRSPWLSCRQGRVGAGGSTLIGQLSGVTNAGTHRRPLPDCSRTTPAATSRVAWMRPWRTASTGDAASWPPMRSIRPRRTGTEHALLGHARRRPALRLPSLISVPNLPGCRRPDDTFPALPAAR